MATHPSYPCLGDSKDRGAWRGTVHEVTKSQTRLSILHPPPSSPSFFWFTRLSLNPLPLPLDQDSHSLKLTSLKYCSDLSSAPNMSL